RLQRPGAVSRLPRRFGARIIPRRAWLETRAPKSTVGRPCRVCVSDRIAVRRVRAIDVGRRRGQLADRRAHSAELEAADTVLRLSRQIHFFGSTLAMNARASFTTSSVMPMCP